MVTPTPVHPVPVFLLGLACVTALHWSSFGRRSGVCIERSRSEFQTTEPAPENAWTWVGEPDLRVEMSAELESLSALGHVSDSDELLWRRVLSQAPQLYAFVSSEAALEITHRVDFARGQSFASRCAMPQCSPLSWRMVHRVESLRLLVLAQAQEPSHEFYKRITQLLNMDMDMLRHGDTVLAGLVGLANLGDTLALARLVIGQRSLPALDSPVCAPSINLLDQLDQLDLLLGLVHVNALLEADCASFDGEEVCSDTRRRIHERSVEMHAALDAIRELDTPHVCEILG